MIRAGETKALIPESGYTESLIKGGENGKVEFAYGKFKPLITVGELDWKSKMPFTGYPDGNAAWLRDDSTVSVAYQSESYGPHFSWGRQSQKLIPGR